MKASGKLLYGVQIGDVIHYDYTVTLPVMKHTVKALASTMDALGETDTPAAYVHYRVALLAEVLESLGSLSKDDITADFLLENLIEDDLDILDAELAGLKKADACSAKLAGLRRATLILGRFGISADRIEGMTVSELTHWLDDLDGLHGRKPTARASHIKSRRTRKKKGKR